MTIAGWILSGLSALFLLFDGGAKLVGASFAVQATTELGFNAAQARTLGALLSTIVVLYVVPQTSILGAVLLTGYLGGTVAIHYQQGNPLLSHVLFGVYIGLMAWGGLFLRVPALREMLPLMRAG